MSDEKVINSTTQDFLDVYDIVNDMVILKDGTVSMILQVGTMNFSLLAEQEQDAIIFTYGSLLNSLNYPIQISIQSQTKDVTKYLRLLDEQIKKASTDRKAKLIKKYREFVAALIKERNVLQKNFFVTIPASPAELGLLTASNILPGKTTFNVESIEKSIILEKASNLLGPRRDHLISQFNRLGLYTKQLTTQEIIQNFYINYNPEAAEGQEISSSENYTTPLVRASFGRKNMQASMPNNTNQATPQGTSTNQEIPAPIVDQQPVAPQVPESANTSNSAPISNPTTLAAEPAQEATQETNSSEVSPEEILSGTEDHLATPVETPVAQGSPEAVVSQDPVTTTTSNTNSESVSTPEIPQTNGPTPEQTVPGISRDNDVAGINLNSGLIDQQEQNSAQELNPILGNSSVPTPQQTVPESAAQFSATPANQNAVFTEEIKPMQQPFENTSEQTIPAAPTQEPIQEPVKKPEETQEDQNNKQTT